MALLKRLAEWIDQKVPLLHIKITESADSMTIYCEVTRGGTA